jgi:site-specific DNA-methyltransferase (adenine-specific)
MPNINLHLGDSLEAMRQMPDNHYTLAIVDPPYGFGDKKTNILNFRQNEQHRDWNIAPPDEYFDQLRRVSKNQIVWGGNYFGYLWANGCRCFVYWHKGNPVPNFADGELAYTSFDQNARCFNYRYYGNHCGDTVHKQKKFHPTQKPVQLYLWLLDTFAKPGDTILDTHLGSGSIACACYDAGYDLDAWEIDPEYHAAATARYKEHSRQTKLF